MRSYWDEDLAILSAENVSFSLETAGLGSRLAALSVDSALQLLVAALVGSIVLGIAGYFNLWVYLAPLIDPPQQLFLFLSTVFTLFVIGYYVLFEWLWDGQTPGKRFFGLRVTTTAGLPLALWPVLIRNAVRVVDFLPMFYGLGAGICLANNLNQRGGDLAAGTIVVHEGKRAKVGKALSMRDAVDGFLQAATTVPGAQQAAPYRDEPLQIEAAHPVDSEALALSHKLNREDYELARDFLARRETLPRVARERLAQSLATRLCGKINAPPPLDAEAFLAQTVATLSRAYAG